MNPLVSLRTALRALVKNKLRSMLAMLGIVIAVSAVVATVAIGQGAEAKVANQMASLGTNLLVVQGGSLANHGVATGAGATQNLTRDDATAVERELTDSVAAVSPSSRTNAQVVYGDQNWSTQIQGASPSFLDIRSWTLAQGDGFTREDDSAAAKVCVLGQTVVDKLFPAGAQVIGEEIRVKAVPCKVVGVLAPKGQSASGQDQDDVVLMPWTTVARRLMGSQSDTVQQILVLAQPGRVDDAQNDVTSLLRQRHHIEGSALNDFDIRNLAAMQDAAKSSTQTVAILLGSVALISLVVGAIGIANVMLVSVTERTREIGLRMAIGARGRDVLFQFLTEAVALACVGGVIGIFIGSVATRLMAMHFQWQALLSLPVMAGTILLAGLAGVVSGFYPAFRASRLDPIDALRFE
jgi:putative ABC transport system permease protein